MPGKVGGLRGHSPDCDGTGAEVESELEMASEDVNRHEVADAVRSVPVVEDDAVLRGRLQRDLDVQPGEDGASESGISQVAGSVERRHLERRAAKLTNVHESTMTAFYEQFLIFTAGTQRSIVKREAKRPKVANA